MTYQMLVNGTPLAEHHRAIEAEPPVELTLSNEAQDKFDAGRTDGFFRVFYHPADAKVVLRTSTEDAALDPCTDLEICFTHEGKASILWCLPAESRGRLPAFLMETDRPVSIDRVEYGY